MAATSGECRFAAAVSLLAEAIKAHLMPGCAYGLYAGGAVQRCGALGHFTYDEPSPPVTPATRFDVASLTKAAATTAAVMLLHHRGRLDLGQHLGEVLPGFIIGREDSRRARQVTLAHLLAHSSGLPGYVELYRTARTPAEMLKACLQLPVEAEPGTRAEYSDPGFILLGKAIEELAGEPLDAWCEREIFEPLGMKATGFNPAPGERALIPPTELGQVFRRRVIQGEVQDENASVMNGVAGHAGLFSSVRDLLSFAGAILTAEPRAAGKTLFHAETVARFAERQPPAGSTRALGWDTPSEAGSSAGKFFSPHSIGHLGYSGCSLWIDLEAKVAVALLTNRTWPDRAEETRHGITALRPAFHDAIRQAIQ
jgi:CubicO group peptidase (beta-lactamase class C family)